MSGITEARYPIFLTIDWGDGTSETFDNKTYKNYRENSIIPEILYGKFSSVLQTTYEHVYHPSESSLIKQLTAQIYIEYGGNEFSWFLIPIKIENDSYFDVVGDMDLLHTNILPLTSNPKQQHFALDKGGYLVEVQR